MMDKNLWASAVGTWPASYGYYYQRGNNFGFWNGIVWYTNQDWSATIVTTSTKVLNPQLWYTSSTFVNATGDPYYWANPQNADLWPEGSQWPCPSGYHIPTQTERINLYNAWVKIYSGDAMYATNGKANLFRNTLRLPMAGLRYLTNGTSLSEVEVTGNYWSSTPYTILRVYTLFFNGSNVVVDYAGGRPTYGKSVRCFKNSY